MVEAVRIEPEAKVPVGRPRHSRFLNSAWRRRFNFLAAQDGGGRLSEALLQPLEKGGDDSAVADAVGSCRPGVHSYGCGFPGAGAGSDGERRGGAERVQLEPPAAGPVDGGIVSQLSRVGKGARKLWKGNAGRRACQPFLS